MLTLQIKEKEIENLTPEEEFIRGTVGAKCQINFDEFWQGYEKYIVFKRIGYEPINIMVDSLENEIEIPYTILAESGEFKIGVFGITETETLPTLYSKDIKIRYGTDTHGTTPPTYTPSEIDQLRLSKQDKLVSGKNIKTVNGNSILGSGNITIEGGSDVEVDQTYSPNSENAQSGKAVAEAITNKANKPKVTSITVDTPIWTNQPTIVGGGALHGDFKKWTDDFYYCTLKNTDGSALPDGQFKLMTKFDDPTAAIDQIFQLSNLFTGNSGWLSENITIDFKEVGNSWKMRNGGVSSVECSEKVLNREIYVSGYFSVSSEGATYFQYLPNIKNGVTYSNMPDYFYADGSFVLFWAIPVNTNTHKMALASAVFKVKALNSIMICDGSYTARTFLKRADISTNKGVGNFCSDNSKFGTLIKNDGTAITLDDITDLPFFTYGDNQGEILNGTNIMFVDEV